MSETYYLADTHLCHSNIHKFRSKPDGTGFESADEHDTFVMDTWNTFIPPKAKVIIAGDAAFNVRGLQKLASLHGDKHIVAGNHDKAVATMMQYVGKVSAMDMKSVDGFHTITTHIPIHFSQLERWHLNIHGHVHANSIDDPRYYNISLEALQFIPITLDEILADVTKKLWGN